MKYKFKVTSKDKIINRFGIDFFTKVKKLIEPLSTKWEIYELELVKSFSASLIFQGKSNIYGSIVMKFGIKHDEFLSEVEALSFF